ncbi:hypothetical protein GCM10027065_31090 [Rhodanobacter koreensis]
MPIQLAECLLRAGYATLDRVINSYLNFKCIYELNKLQRETTMARATRRYMRTIPLTAADRQWIQGRKKENCTLTNSTPAGRDPAAPEARFDPGIGFAACRCFPFSMVLPAHRAGFGHRDEP